jgi:thiol-disulfide isomerase/thioredoxin
MMGLKITTSTVLVALCMFMGPERSCASDAEPEIIVTSEREVRFEDGIEIQLVAVSNWQWEQVWEEHLKALGEAGERGADLWWRPEGTLLKNVDFRRGRQASGNTNAFNFLIRTAGLKDGDVVACEQAHADTHTVYRGDVRDSGRTPKEGYHVFYIADFPYPPSTTSVFVGIASGKWHVVESEEHDWARFEPDDIMWVFDSALAAKWPYQKGDDVIVELSHIYVKSQTRLQMTDGRGEVLVADQEQRSRGAGIINVHYTFEDVSLEDVNEIRFMKRDYTRWIEFKDVTLAFEGIKPFYTWGRLMELRGKPAPEFAEIQEWSTGIPLTMAELKGKVVLLDFWNVNCGPCVTMFPRLMSLHDKYHERGLAIIGVHADIGLSVAQAKARMAGFKKQLWQGRDVPFPIAFDGGGDRKRPGTTATSWGATNAAYAITSYPTSILIDREGNVDSQIDLHKPGYEETIETLVNE